MVFYYLEKYMHTFLVASAVATFGAAIVAISGGNLYDLWNRIRDRGCYINIGDVRLSQSDLHEVVFGLSRLDYPSVLHLPLQLRMHLAALCTMWL